MRCGPKFVDGDEPACTFFVSLSISYVSQIIFEAIVGLLESFGDVLDHITAAKLPLVRALALIA